MNNLTHQSDDSQKQVSTPSAGPAGVAQILPELPAYLEAACWKLQDDKEIDHPAFRALSALEKQAFVRKYVRSGSLRAACEHIKVTVPLLYRHLELDPDFARCVSVGKLEMGDKIQSVSYKRALEPSGVVDRMCQLKRFFPSVYREQSPTVVMQVNLNEPRIR